MHILRAALISQPARRHSARHSFLIQTILSAPESHRVMPATGRLAGFTAGGEMLPAPKRCLIIYILARCSTLVNTAGNVLDSRHYIINDVVNITFVNL